MLYLLFIIVLVLLFGPLRPSAGRHWAFLVSVGIGAALGWVIGSVLASYGLPSFAPWLGAGVGILETIQWGPAFLRTIEKDGKD